MVGLTNQRHPDLDRDPLRRGVLRPDQRYHARLSQRVERVVPHGSRRLGCVASAPPWPMNQIPNLGLRAITNRLDGQADLSNRLIVLPPLCQPEPVAV